MTTQSINPMDTLIRHLSTLTTADLTRIATVGARFALALPQSPVTLAIAPLVTWLLHESPRGPLEAPAGLTATQLRESAWVVHGAGDDLARACPEATELALVYWIYSRVLSAWASRKATLN